MRVPVIEESVLIMTVLIMLDSPGRSLLVRAWHALLMTEERPLPGSPMTATVLLILFDDDREEDALEELEDEETEGRGAGGATPIGSPMIIGLLP
jgi:hypothetical protein